MAENKMSLKLLVDKRNQTILFAEAGKDFVDFLFHGLALPVGTIVSLLSKAGVASGVRNLYASVENLSDTYIERREKEALLKPKARSSGPDVLRSLLPEAPPLAPIKYYTCHHISGPAADAASSAKIPSGKGGYVRDVVTYVVMDDLTVKPMSIISCVTLFNRFNVHEIGDLEERVVDFGLDKAANFLEIPTLLDLASAVVADMMKVKPQLRYAKFSISRIHSHPKRKRCEGEPVGI
ncbi:uncharacterized protein LOC120289099 [Eucalyptus grandis]|uniref:uncharacterized protein LOC120289099 n=1 Tax=Eucalyptus grandis TaxID=71139 RepID=UPI00192F0B0A|nr:uncharacterized protein LOC120289099 [Eucalyptus grandis]